MASPMNSISRQDASALVRQVQSSQLINRQLSSVCQVNGIKSTGVKADIQTRIINLIQESVNANDAPRFHQIRQSITNQLATRSSPYKAPPGRFNFVPQPPATALLPGHTPPNAMAPYNHSSAGASRDYRAPGYNSAPAVLLFKESPFYEIESRLSDIRVCDVMQQHRHSVHIPLKLNSHPRFEQWVDDKSYRVMIFCASDSIGKQDIAFPHQSELRVNGDEIKANLRGLKSKPGSTRPVDITDSLRMKANYQNNVEFIYALTSKKFFIVVQLCKVTSVHQLVAAITPRIPRSSVVAELNKKAQDPDVVATSQVLSLKCPLSYGRLQVPCRGLSCTHIQCFDATSYLQLQEQGPQWLCPICNKSAPYKQLAVDEYVRDILENTSVALDTVTIEPNGNWLKKSPEEERNSRLSNGNSLMNNGDDDDDDDDVEISEVSMVGGRRFTTPRTQVSSNSTPMSGGLGSSNGVPRGVASTSAKRPAAAVIDLTFSSDEDDEPIQRPQKRQHTESNSYRGQDGRNFLSESPIGYL